ncbi:MAG: dicarboxylate/amino acid:cation symporter [Pseudobdellovibrionaceae bacterium]|nr:dicarboxylate/amino acid:cation symporter [Bdellovibrionales bacterium]USN48273.1 MAG: dicarboxylate/amino acid:cation symporter [Pseudobdellovibrionaceae bacterium]
MNHTLPDALPSPKTLIHLSGELQKLLNQHLWAKIVFGLVLGLGFGVIIGPEMGWVSPQLSSTIGEWVALPGRIFLAIVQMVVMPLIFASVVRGLASSGSLENLKNLGLKVIVYYTATTVTAVTVGLLVAQLIQPGHSIDPEKMQSFLNHSQSSAQTPPPEGNLNTGLSINQIPKTLPSLLPSNPLNAMVSDQMLQVVLFAVFIGVALITLSPSVANPLIQLLYSIQEVCMVVIRWAMRLAPVAVFGLMTQLTSQVGFEILTGLSVYIATVLLGLFVVLLIYLSMVALLGRTNPFVFLKSIREVQLLAFSTSSSAAVMPLSIKTAEEKLHVRTEVSRFLVPLGATINMDGTALYQGVATLFLAQLFHVDLTLTQLTMVVITATMASIGAPGTPGVGIVILSMILSSVGIPTSGIMLIMGVDRLLDMSRTVINVSGDMTACLIMNRLTESSPSKT